MSTLNLDGVKSIKGKNVKLLYIDSCISLDPVVLGKFDDIWVYMPHINDLFMQWELMQGFVYIDALSCVTKSQNTVNNMLNNFILGFTLEDLEYEDEYHGKITTDESMQLALKNCTASTYGLTSYKPTDKIIFVSEWNGLTESLWRWKETDRLISPESR